MGENSNIEWTDHTFNPWRGCTHATAAGEAHPGCEHCYAEQLSKRNPKALGVWGEDGVRVMGSVAYLRQPQKWNEAAEREGVRKRVFCASLADVFEDWDGPILNSQGGVELRAWSSQPATMDDVRYDLFSLIDSTPWLDWLLLTKRPQNVRRMWPLEKRAGHVSQNEGDGIERRYRPNVWLLTSVSNQATADALVPELLKCRDLVPVLGLSCEPLLGPINLGRIPCERRSEAEAARNGLNDWTTLYSNPLTGFRASSMVSGYTDPKWKLDWVIAGGESGPHARPMHPDWARSLRNQCQAAGVPFFFKQWGEFAPIESVPGLFAPCVVLSSGELLTGERVLEQPGDDAAEIMGRVGKKAAGRLLDETESDEFPKT